MARDAAVAEPVLEARGLSKYFGEVPALNGVTLSVRRGEPLLVYGPNGAGKTTLLRIFASLSAPTEGEVLLGGERIDSNPARSKAKVGFVSHATYLYGDLTICENLQLAGRLFGLDGLETRVGDVLELFGLRERRRERVRSLSRGLQQRVTLARALLHNPEVLLLDEPFTGLDAESAARLENLLREVAERGKAVVFSTHSFRQGARIARRSVVLDRGRVRYDGPVDGARVTGVEAARQPAVS